MKVFKPSTKVVLSIGNIKGIITGVLIRRNDVEYYIRHLSNWEFKEDLFSDFEFEVIYRIKKAGFNQETETEENNYLLELRWSWLSTLEYNGWENVYD